MKFSSKSLSPPIVSRRNPQLTRPEKSLKFELHEKRESRGLWILSKQTKKNWLRSSRRSRTCDENCDRQQNVWLLMHESGSTYHAHAIKVEREARTEPNATLWRSLAFHGTGSDLHVLLIRISLHMTVNYALTASKSINVRRHNSMLRSKAFTVPASKLLPQLITKLTVCLAAFAALSSRCMWFLPHVIHFVFVASERDSRHYLRPSSIGGKKKTPQQVTAKREFIGISERIISCATFIDSSGQKWFLNRNSRSMSSVRKPAIETRPWE